MEFVTLLKLFLIQILSTLGVIVIFGLIIDICHKVFYGNLRKYGNVVFYTTALIGAPIHELSHALFCVLFGHKITFFNPFCLTTNSESQLWAHVEHQYNRKNIYQQIGNFFIGIGPILVMSTLIFILAYFLLPEFSSNAISIFSSIERFSFNEIKRVFLALFSSFFSYVDRPIWWLIFVITLVFSLHMTLSPSDIKGAISGAIFLLITWFIIDIILWIFNQDALIKMSDFDLLIGALLTCIFSFALLFVVVMVLISFVIRLLNR